MSSAGLSGHGDVWDAHEPPADVGRTRARGWHAASTQMTPPFKREAANSRLLLDLVDTINAGDPGARRAKPALPLGRELVALGQNPDPHRIGRLLTFTLRRRIDRRPTLRAERL